MLTLPIKKKWYDMILSGEKKEEYRSYNDYYGDRLDKYILNGKFPVRFRNGYRLDSPMIECEVSVLIGRGEVEWGAEDKKIYYVLTIHSVKEIKHEEN
jgi:hypothetical protein